MKSAEDRKRVERFRCDKNVKPRVYNKLRVCKGYWRLSYRYYMVDEPWGFPGNDVCVTKGAPNAVPNLFHVQFHSHPTERGNFIRCRYRELLLTFIFYFFYSFCVGLRAKIINNLCTIHCSKTLDYIHYILYITIPVVH